MKKEQIHEGVGFTDRTRLIIKGRVEVGNNVLSRTVWQYQHQSECMTGSRSSPCDCEDCNEWKPVESRKYTKPRDKMEELVQSALEIGKSMKMGSVHQFDGTIKLKRQRSEVQGRRPKVVHDSCSNAKAAAKREGIIDTEISIILRTRGNGK